jgi:hypothetical protein
VDINNSYLRTMDFAASGRSPHPPPLFFPANYRSLEIATHPQMRAQEGGAQLDPFHGGN